MFAARLSLLFDHGFRAVARGLAFTPSRFRLDMPDPALVSCEIRLAVFRLGGSFVFETSSFRCGPVPLTPRHGVHQVGGYVLSAGINMEWTECPRRRGTRNS